VKQALRGLAVGLSLLLAAAVSGCTDVVETRAFRPGVEGLGSTCTTPFGVYYLPKALLKVVVQGPPNTRPEPSVESVFVADETQRVCLDYLTSLTSDDIIKVTRNADGLLEAVSSDVTDKSPEIALKLLNVAENAAIASRLAEEAGPNETANLSFDPFDDRQVAGS
jgi:hypothetical protein